MNIASLTLSVFEPFGEAAVPPPPFTLGNLIGGEGVAGQVPVNYAFRSRDNRATQRRPLANRLDVASETNREV